MSALRRAWAFALLLCTLLAAAQRELRDIPDPDPELERQTLEVGEGLEVNLYAADPLLAKPIHINFDAQGRLWVASSEVYPHVKPGQAANDKILVLEDADGDGRAEKTFVFADGLLIPTGVEPGDGGAYVANSTELLHLKDTDGDGKADTRRVMLSGFGTEDTHHILHTLRWGPDGMLYFNQSIYIHSHIETPHGVRRLNSGGIWQFRPETMQLEVFTRGLCNPWGHIFDRWGQSFATDGAGGEGINYVFPGATLFTYAGAKKVLRGLNPGSPKHCGLEVVSGRHFPDDWQGSLITNDFRAHRVCRFVVSDSGAGFSSRQQAAVIKTKHVAFRPIDAKMGPDGALYIADWYNPIIQHGEVDFRDERRDHTHGRIWRVTVKGRPLVERPKIVDASVDQLLEMLRAPEDFTRLHAKLQLKARGSAVRDSLAAWLAALDRSDEQYEHCRLEGLWTYQALDVVEPRLVTELTRAKNPQVRAAATRVLAHWHTRVPEAPTLLTALVHDEHPRVRLEAVRALSRLDTANSAELAARVLDHPMDRFLDHALWLAARDLQPRWLPALEAGEVSFGGNPAHLTFMLEAAESPNVVGPIMKLVASEHLPPERRPSLLLLVASLGGPSELRTLLDQALSDKLPGPERVALLRALADAARMRKVQPSGDLAAIGRLIAAEDESLRIAAIDAAGLWRVESLRAALTALATANDTSEPLRRAALQGLALLGGDSASALVALCKPDQQGAMRGMATIALATLDVKAAAESLVTMLGEEPCATDPAPIVVAILDRKGGAAALTETITSRGRLPGDAAKLTIRAVWNAAREEPELVAALSTVGGIKGTAIVLSPDELKKLVAEVGSQGSAERGEAVFRRNDMLCLKCHAVAGAGGRVGPDLVSIGASAPVDYLVDSILQPTAKIKENYHSLTVVADGVITSGVKVRETDTELVLRDVEDREVAIAVDAIEARKDGGSLMPVGLTDTLTRGELVDLVRFLSELGKVGPYAVGQARVVRRWEVASGNDLAPAIDGDDSQLALREDVPWVSAYSRVSGHLPLDSVPTRDPKAGDSILVRCQLDVTEAGPVELVADGPIQKAWADGAPLKLASKATVDLSVGLHTITLAVSRASGKTLRLELADVPGSKAQVLPVGGK